MEMHALLDHLPLGCFWSAASALPWVHSERDEPHVAKDMIREKLEHCVLKS